LTTTGKVAGFLLSGSLDAIYVHKECSNRAVTDAGLHGEAPRSGATSCRAQVATLGGAVGGAVGGAQ
jgi:hypothetical protein